MIVVPGENGRIRQAQIHDVANEATWDTDGGLLLEDGRLHVYPANTLLFDFDASSVGVVTDGPDGKYVLQGDDLHEVIGWQRVADAPLPPTVF